MYIIFHCKVIFTVCLLTDWTVLSTQLDQVPSLPLLATQNLTTVTLCYNLPKSQINPLQQIWKILSCLHCGQSS